MFVIFDRPIFLLYRRVGPLPDGWTVSLDPETNKLYYSDGTTQSWEFPSKTRHDEKMPQLFVKSIPLDTTNDEFTELFRPFGSTDSFLIKAEGRTTAVGIVTFPTEAERDALLEQQLTLGGKTLTIQRYEPHPARINNHRSTYHSQSPYPEPNDAFKYKRQIFIPWLPSSTTSADVNQALLVYNPHSVILPRYPDGTIKGFAFVEFANETQRDRILQTQKSVELHGVSCELRKCFRPHSQSPASQSNNHSSAPRSPHPEPILHPRRSPLPRAHSHSPRHLKLFPYSSHSLSTSHPLPPSFPHPHSNSPILLNRPSPIPPAHTSVEPALPLPFFRPPPQPSNPSTPSHTETETNLNTNKD